MFEFQVQAIRVYTKLFKNRSELQTTYAKLSRKYKVAPFHMILRFQVNRIRIFS